MAHKDTSIAIIGGGIGGLTAALLPVAGWLRRARLRAGHRTLREVGAGIVISPECDPGILHGLGFRRAVGDVGRAAGGVASSDVGTTAASLFRVPPGRATVAAQFGFPHYQIASCRTDAGPCWPTPAARPPGIGHRLHRPRRPEAIASKQQFENGTRIVADALISRAPMASTRWCARGAVRTRHPRFTGLYSPIAASCRPTGSPAPRPLGVTNAAWMGTRQAISCTTSCRADVWSILLA